MACGPVVTYPVVGTTVSLDDGRVDPGAGAVTVGIPLCPEVCAAELGPVSVAKTALPEVGVPVTVLEEGKAMVTPPLETEPDETVAPVPDCEALIPEGGAVVSKPLLVGVTPDKREGPVEARDASEISDADWEPDRLVMGMIPDPLETCEADSPLADPEADGLATVFATVPLEAASDCDVDDSLPSAVNDEVPIGMTSVPLEALGDCVANTTLPVPEFEAVAIGTTTASLDVLEDCEIEDTALDPVPRLRVETPRADVREAITLDRGLVTLVAVGVVPVSVGDKIEDAAESIELNTERGMVAVPEIPADDRMELTAESTELNADKGGVDAVALVNTGDMIEATTD